MLYLFGAVVLAWVPFALWNSILGMIVGVISESTAGSGIVVSGGNWIVNNASTYSGTTTLAGGASSTTTLVALTTAHAITPGFSVVRITRTIGAGSSVIP